MVLRLRPEFHHIEVAAKADLKSGSVFNLQNFQKCPRKILTGNGGGGMEEGGETAAPASVSTDANEFLPWKRLRSSGSYTVESLNSAETGPKKVKVQVLDDDEILSLFNIFLL